MCPVFGEAVGDNQQKNRLFSGSFIVNEVGITNFRVLQLVELVEHEVP